MSWGTEKTMEAQKMTKCFTAKFIGHGCNVYFYINIFQPKKVYLELLFPLSNVSVLDISTNLQILDFQQN